MLSSITDKRKPSKRVRPASKVNRNVLIDNCHDDAAKEELRLTMRDNEEASADL